MIQELFAGNTILIGGGDNNISKQFNTSTPSSSPLSCTTSNSNITPATATASANASPSSNSENLRCPRCDSPKTKFCYYNNYNLTQPRHFCKTCRRYWTKGGALRNVPIGGGCRKNKTNTGITTAKSSTAKLKNSLPCDLIGKFGIFEGFEQEIIPSSNNNPFLFSSPQNHNHNHNPLISLLRGNHQNLNFFKEEQKSIGVNSYNQFPSDGLCLWKNNKQNGTIVGEVQSTGFQELYQSLKASTSRCYPDYAPSSSSMILESAPVAGGELGFWNPSLSTWSDMPTANGAYL